MKNATRRRGMLRVHSLSLAAALGATLFGNAAAADPAPVVNTDAGKVAGVPTGLVDAFLGVPYAAPPLGNLRFRPPQPHAPWAATLPATQVAAPCPQVRGGNIGSEDCLYLNIYAPRQSAQTVRRPVMVWFPGGLFQAGSGTFPYYNGQYIAEQAGVIVVTVSYRIGALGFLTAPALDQENPARLSGNYGLEDQQAALRWVQRNVGAFGGDPRNVTIFGESAGGNSVEYHLASPLSSGLFERAIIESAAGQEAIPDLSLAASETGGSATVIAAVGCAGAADAAACLRAVPAYSFLGASNLVTPRVFPVVDGAVLPRTPLQAFRSGQFNRVPTIIGNNREEATALVWPIEAANGPLTVAGYNAQLNIFYGNDAAAVLAEYPISAYPSAIDALAASQTDSTFACPAALKRAALSRYVPVYGYELNEQNPARGPSLGPPEPGLDYGAYHTSDIPYVFGVSAPNGDRVTGKDLALSQRIIAYWTNLAIAGNPDLPQFRTPPWFDIRFLHLLLSLQDSIAYLPERQFDSAHHCNFWNALLPENRP